MDDAEDLDVVTQLLEPTPPGSFLLSNTDVLPGTGSEVFPMEPVCNLQMFTQVWRSKAHYTNGNFDKQLQRMLQVSPVCLICVSNQNISVHVDSLGIIF